MSSVAHTRTTAEVACRGERSQGRAFLITREVGGPGGSGVVGGRGKQKNRKQRGAGGPALRIRPRREKKSDLEEGARVCYAPLVLCLHVDGCLSRASAHMSHFVTNRSVRALWNAAMLAACRVHIRSGMI